MNADQVIQQELLPGEQIVWTGQPDPSKIFGPGDLFLVPFSLLWGGFALFWEGGVLGLGAFGEAKGHPAPFFFMLWGIPFVLIGQYFIWGRFIYKSWVKKRTYYALTDRRVLMIADGFKRTSRSQELSALSTIEKQRGKGRSGSILFGSLPFMASSYANSGMDLFGGAQLSGILAFYDLKDMETVYQLIYQQKEAHK